MIQRDVLHRVLDALQALDIPYMIVGSFASTYWGRPRTTHDADLLVEMPVAKAPLLARALQTEFYAPEFALSEAAQQRSHANVIHLQYPFKVDLWMVQEDDYDRERFGRRRSATMFERQVWVSSPEDIILSKLRWYQMSPVLQRQLQDAVEVYEIQESDLDQAYLDRWAEHLRVTDLLREVREQAARPPNH